MAKLQQSQPIAPPLPSDKDFQQYTSVIQSNIFDLWNYAHTHTTGSGIGVTSLNGLLGAITLAAGTNILLNQAGNTITIVGVDSDSPPPPSGLSQAQVLARIAIWE